ncbi:conserved hypothetical protein [metagenome]
MNEQIQKINDFVTQICNKYHITPQQKNFLRRCVTINVLMQKPFSYNDFPHMTHNNFRQMIYRLKNFIELHIKSSVSFYRIKGITLGLRDISVTELPMGEEVFLLLSNVTQQPAAIHDIKMKFKSCLHNVLKNNPHITPHLHNKGLSLEYVDLIPGYRIHVLVYPSIVQVDISCTFHPIVFNTSGALLLVALLSKLHEHLRIQSNCQCDIPFFFEWIITHYHFGKDGTEEYNGNGFNMTFHDAVGGMIRYYSKSMETGKTILRAEQVRTPKRKLRDELELMFQQDNNHSNQKEF